MAESGMDARSKKLLAAVFILVVASAILTYYRTMYTRNFPVENTPVEELEE